MIRFEWDEAKARSNTRKHGVRFEDAMLVFADPYALAGQDRVEGGEVRWQTLGLAGGIVMLLVAHTSGTSEETRRFASFRLEEQPGRSGSRMTKTVKRNLSNSRLTASRKRRLAEISRQPDEEIDTSEIPELDEKFWQNAVRNPFYRPVKQQLTLRLDADIIAWLRKQGRGYQTRANALLREAMLGDLSPKKAKSHDPLRPNNSRRGVAVQTRRAG
jgi:uncharacterized protein (DUF4415 family)/uncharacterized DUF497 family protein